MLSQVRRTSQRKGTYAFIYSYYYSFCPPTMYRTWYIIWSDKNLISMSTCSTPVFPLFITLRRYISLFPFLKSPRYNFHPWQTLEIPYSSSMLHPHVIDW